MGSIQTVVFGSSGNSDLVLLIEGCVVKVIIIGVWLWRILLCETVWRNSVLREYVLKALALFSVWTSHSEGPKPCSWYRNPGYDHDWSPWSWCTLVALHMHVESVFWHDWHIVVEVEAELFRVLERLLCSTYLHKDVRSCYTGQRWWPCPMIWVSGLPSL